VTSTRELELAAALARVRQRVARAAESAGRDAADIELLPITKFFPASDVLILTRLGCNVFGESREQEGAAKAAEVDADPAAGGVRWHMVGRVQRNKAASIANWAQAVHSADSAKLVTALDHAAAAALATGRRGRLLRLYVQLSLDGDTERGGVDISRPDLIDELCDQVDAAESLELAGLMAIPPLGVDPDDAFARLAAERRRVQQRYPQALGLSAGMSGDLEVAVKHGSTCVRVGTALMGPRPLTSP
jgi:pyridoxal phosphate enzyme (YggS family)